MKISEAIFTVFDFETTGLYPYTGDRICEIGAIRFGRGKPAKRFHSMVDPGRPVSSGAFSVNGITEEMFEGAPTIGAILPDFMDFVKDSVLVAYNAGFDLGFLESALGSEKQKLDNYPVIDALRLARRLFPEAGRYSLASVSHHLGVVIDGEHRAMADAIMTLKVFRKELAALKKAGVASVEDIVYSRTSKRPMPGKVKDYKLRMIEEAISRQKRLHIVYRSTWTDSVTERTIAPKLVQHGYDKSYVVAFCHRAGAERNFRLDGILEIEPQKEGGL